MSEPSTVPEYEPNVAGLRQSPEYDQAHLVGRRPHEYPGSVLFVELQLIYQAVDNVKEDMDIPAIIILDFGFHRDPLFYVCLKGLGQR